MGDEPYKSKRKRQEEEEDDDTTPQNAWELKPFVKGEMKSALVAESSFSVMYPKASKSDVEAMWPQVVAALDPQGIQASIDKGALRMTVMTTARTWDPYAILKARDLIRLVTRGMQVDAASKVLEDGFDCEIITIGGHTEKMSSFTKRRQRLIGPNGATQKAIELLTGCSLAILGTTVAVVGPYKGLDQARRIVEDAMTNKVHPVYNIKELMARRELAKDPSVANENWARLVPSYLKVKQPKKEKPEKEGEEEAPKKKVQKKKKEYSPFPNAPTPRQVDLDMESGAYLLTAEQKEEKEREEKEKRMKERTKERLAKKGESFVAPSENTTNKKKKNKKKKEKESASEDAIANIKKNVGFDKPKQVTSSDFLLSSKHKKQKS